MKYETIITAPDIWCPVLQDTINVDFYFIINVEDASFSHDWAGGGVEHQVEAVVENMYYGFQYKGRAVLFDPDSGHVCLADVEQIDIDCAEEAAIEEAIHAFKYPEGTWEDYL